MNLPPDFAVIVGMICMLFFIIRTYFYLQLWNYKNTISKDGEYLNVFPKGLKKFMMPINLSSKIKDPEIMSIIKKVNLFNYLEFLSIFIAFLIVITGE